MTETYGVRISRSARKHRIGTTRIRAAMIDAGNPSKGDGDQLIYIGRDDRGVELFIIAVPDDRNPQGVTVIHCTPKRMAHEEQAMSEDTSQYRVGADTTFREVNLDEVEVLLPDGRRLTEKLAEELAEETIRQRGGRPSLSGEGVQSPQLGVRLSPDLHRRVRERAALEGKKPSQVVREALEYYLNAAAS